jgi:protein translocase SecG subunit
MKNAFIFFQIIISLALIGLVLLQAKGTGLGSRFGQQDSSFLSKRGIDLLVFRITIVISAIFLISSIIQVLAFK